MVQLSKRHYLRSAIVLQHIKHFISHTYKHIISNTMIIKLINIESKAIKRKNGKDDYTQKHFINNMIISTEKIQRLKRKEGIDYAYTYMYTL